MKKQRIILMSCTLLLAGVAIFIACSKEHTNTNPQTTEEQPCTTCGKSSVYWIPENGYTATKEIQKKNNDGTEGVQKVVTIHAPKYIYIGYNANGEIVPITISEKEAKAASTGSVTVTCSCSEPINGSRKAACEAYPGRNPRDPSHVTVTCIRNEYCAKCEQNTNSSIAIGGFVDIYAPVSFAPVQVNLPYAFQAMYAYPQIQTPLNSFMSSLSPIGKKSAKNIKPLTKSDGMYAPDGYKFTVLNVCGRAMVTLLPEDVLQKHPEAQIFDKMSYPLENKLSENIDYFFYLPPQNAQTEPVKLTLTGASNSEFTIYNN